MDKSIIVGKHTYGVENIKVRFNNTSVEIGSFCSIAKKLTIYAGGNHRHDLVTTYPFLSFIQKWSGAEKIVNNDYSNGDVVIGHDVWIGDNVTIMSGICIGSGAVIASNSHVTKSVDPYSIVGGNPAKLIKYRFTEEQISGLLKIKWWDWGDEKINDNIWLLCGDVDKFISSHRIT